MAQLTPLQYRQILQIAADACGGSPAARARTLEFSTKLTTDDEWNHRKFFITLTTLLGPLPDTIPVFQVVAGQRVPIGNFRYKDAMALICARLMIRNIGIPNSNVLIPLMAMFRPGLWNLVNIDHIGIEHVDGAEEEPPAPEVPLQVIKIPEGQTDAITFADIPDGTRMVDFHGEKAMHRYYTEATYKSLKKPEKKPYKENPYTRQPIVPADLTRYIAKLDSTMPVQEAGRRKSRKSKRRARKTRRRYK